jgi:hypothetical protein
VGEPQPGLDWEPAGPKPETEQPAAYITAFPLAGLARGMAVIRIDDLANGRIEEKVSTPRRTPDYPAARLPGPIHLSRRTTPAAAPHPTAVLLLARRFETS